jgi:hypothetical protein
MYNDYTIELFIKEKRLNVFKIWFEYMLYIYSSI